MPSKTSKPKARPATSTASLPWRAASACSEEALCALAGQLARELEPGHRVFLEGPMGVGKTTFSRALLENLGVLQPPEGSPSFAIAHEYACGRGEVVHVDFYRIRSRQEILQAGIEAYFWEREAVVIAEWISLWAEFEAEVAGTSRGKVWRVELRFEPQSDSRRSVRVSRG